MLAPEIEQDQAPQRAIYGPQRVPEDTYPNQSLKFTGPLPRSADTPLEPARRRNPCDGSLVLVCNVDAAEAIDGDASNSRQRHCFFHLVLELRHEYALSPTLTLCTSSKKKHHRYGNGPEQCTSPEA
jgi:hypothetical protein